MSLSALFLLSMPLKFFTSRVVGDWDVPNQTFRNTNKTNVEDKDSRILMFTRNIRRLFVLGIKIQDGSKSVLTTRYSVSLKFASNEI